MGRKRDIAGYLLDADLPDAEEEPGMGTALSQSMREGGTGIINVEDLERMRAPDYMYAIARGINRGARTTQEVHKPFSDVANATELRFQRQDARMDKHEASITCIDERLGCVERKQVAQTAQPSTPGAPFNLGSVRNALGRAGAK